MHYYYMKYYMGLWIDQLLNGNNKEKYKNKNRSHKLKKVTKRKRSYEYDCSPKRTDSPLVERKKIN